MNTGTYTGHYEPVKEMADLLDEYEAKTGHSVPIHGTIIYLQTTVLPTDVHFQLMAHPVLLLLLLQP